MFLINEIIAGSSGLLLVVFAVILFTVKKKKQISHYFLLLFLLVNALFLSGFLLRTIFGISSLFQFTVIFTLQTFGLLFGPVLLYYSQSVIHNNLKLSGKDFLHVLPFAGCLTFIIIKFFISDGSPWLIPSGMYFYGFLINTHALFYLVFTFLVLKRYGAEIKNYYSITTEIDYYWLKMVLAGFTAMWLVDYLHFISGQIWDISGNVHSSVLFISLLINLIFAIVIYYGGLKHPEFFQTIEIDDAKPNNGKFKLPENERLSYLSKIQSYMECEKAFLNQNLTITEFSEQVNIPVRFISYVINDSLGHNFFDFVNYYRIEESKKYLSDPKSEKMTVLEILYETGFNSKSTFNKVFKDFTGYTPTQFRRQNLKSPLTS